MKAECISKTKDRYIVFEENRSKLTLINERKVEGIRVKVDGCEIKEGLRCDYLFIAESKEHFIELKGHDVNHAIKQLTRTMDVLSTNPQKQNKICYVVCTRSPKGGTEIQNLKIKFKKNYNSDLIVKGLRCENEL